ncbi:MAG TPA: sigma factor [Thermomicrobiales bacterium]|nr:sigma factor [Thermomicrobiales bacterium]
MGDDPLLERARRGDRQALEELCRREWRPVYALVYHAVQDRAEAEDLTQEVFLRALRSLGRYRATRAL